MSDEKYEAITIELMMVQAKMVSMGVNERKMYLTILQNNPFEGDDEIYFEGIADDLIELCEDAELYEVCESLTTIKDKIREDDREDNIG